MLAGLAEGIVRHYQQQGGQDAAKARRPARMLDEIAGIQTMDVILPTRCGRTIRKRCVGNAPAPAPRRLPQRLRRFPPRPRYVAISCCTAGLIARAASLRLCVRRIVIAPSSSAV